MNGFDCIKCKGRLHCGLPKCPLINQFKSNNIKIKKEFKSLTNGLLVGWNGYPNVRAGILTPFNNKVINYSELINHSITDIINYRSSLINSFKPINIKDVKGFVETIQLTALSHKPLSIDVSLNKELVIKPVFNIHALPNGPAVPIKKLILNDDPHVSKIVRRITEDKDIDSLTAIHRLINNGIKIDFISSLLSAGLLGKKSERRLVPSRWAITAVDDTISKEFINNIKLFQIIDSIKVFRSVLFGNHFIIILFPHQWFFELVEKWVNGSIFNQGPDRIVSDFERFNGRKSYAFNTTGGYYAARFSVSEWLVKNNLQAGVIIIRIISPDYIAPLGVWVVREGVKRAFSSHPLLFNNFKELVVFIKRLTGIDIRSCVNIKLQQSSLNDFME